MTVGVGIDGIAVGAADVGWGATDVGWGGVVGWGAGDAAPEQATAKAANNVIVKTTRILDFIHFLRLDQGQSI
jgi:hypothetical protein